MTTDPAAYLRATPPFDALPEHLFTEVAESLDVSFQPAGTWLARAGRTPLRHLWVIRKGSVRLERGGQTLTVLEDGESFGYTSLLSREATIDVLVEDDLLAYRVPDATFQRLLSDARFASHFAAGLGERLRSSLEHAPVSTFRSDLSTSVRELVQRPPVWVAPDATVGDAARAMREEGVSSVLVRTEPPGILTDRDFRNRVLAEGLDADTPVLQVFSRPLRTVPDAAPLAEGWRVLLDASVHHLPLTRGGEITGVLSATDLVRVSAQGPLAVLRGVERLASRDSLPGYGARVAEMTSSLLAGGLDAGAIAGFVARLNDALLGRILRWAEAELGPPPAPWAWLALGSEGRMEQTLLTDQDNALVYADEGAARRGWYEALAERANADLEAAGFPRCPGGIMARTWHATVTEWRERVAGWIDAPSPRALLDAAIFLDLRPVAGALDVGAIHAVLGEAVEKPVFLRFLAKAALEFRPPPLLLLRLRGTSRVDLKLHGISPVVFLARCFALEARSPERGTIARLEAAVRAGLLAADVCATVSDAYRFLIGLRLRLQLRMIAKGEVPVNEVALPQLSALERTRLKDAFGAVKALQDAASFHFKSEF